MNRCDIFHLFGLVHSILDSLKPFLNSGLQYSNYNFCFALKTQKIIIFFHRNWPETAFTIVLFQQLIQFGVRFSRFIPLHVWKQFHYLKLMIKWKICRKPKFSLTFFTVKKTV